MVTFCGLIWNVNCLIWPPPVGFAVKLLMALDLVEVLDGVWVEG